LPKTRADLAKPRITKDIHDFDTRIKAAQRIIREQLSPKTADLITRYYYDMISSKPLAKATQEKNLRLLLSISKMLGKEWTEANADDVKRVVVDIITRYSPNGQETHTTQDYKKVLKIFFRWLKTGAREKSAETLDPIEIRNIKIQRVKDRLAREDLISSEDLTKILHACGENLRDKALIAVHYEAGTRIGETLTLQIKHIEIDNYGAKIKVDGKTDARPVRLLTSSPYLVAWLNAHPFRDNPDAPLWVNLSKHKYGSQLSYNGARRMIQERGKLANLSKRVYFHLFRHSQITQTANFLTEAQQKKRYGWSSSSKMPSRYTHLVDEDVEEALLGHYGIKKQDKTDLKMPKKCNVCDWPNATDATYCEKCSRALDLKTALEIEEKATNENKEILERMEKIQAEFREKEELVQATYRMLETFNDRFLVPNGIKVDWTGKTQKRMPPDDLSKMDDVESPMKNPN
jgi:integrase/recombinase XerD